MMDRSIRDSSGCLAKGVTQQFRIETGERRYWATWLLHPISVLATIDGN